MNTTRGDLHFHSTDSDGNKTNDERIVQIAQFDPSHNWVYAITNHDMYSPGFVLPARDLAINAIWATEISARSAEWDHSFHVTCYSPTLSLEISRMVSEVLVWKSNKVRLQIDKLASSWLPIDTQSFFSWIAERWFSETNISNGHLAEFLWGRGDTIQMISDMTNGEVNTSKKFLHECLKATWKHKDIWYIIAPPYEPDIGDVLKVANREWAILSIAHPNFSFTKFAREKFWAQANEKSVYEVFEDRIVPYFMDVWIKNFEINASASPRWVWVIKKTVRRIWWLITFWSDNHGALEATDTHGKFWHQNPLLSPELARPITDKLLEFV